MRKSGVIMHDIDDILQEYLDGSNCGVAIEVTLEILQENHRSGREVYIESGRNPIIRMSKTKVDKIVRANIKRKFKPLVRELAVDHELQWGEILGLVHLYAQVHFQNASYKFSYSYSAPTR